MKPDKTTQLVAASMLLLTISCGLAFVYAFSTHQYPLAAINLVFMVVNSYRTAGIFVRLSGGK